MLLILITFILSKLMVRKSFPKKISHIDKLFKLSKIVIQGSFFKNNVT